MDESSVYVSLISLVLVAELNDSVLLYLTGKRSQACLWTLGSSWINSTVPPITVDRQRNSGLTTSRNVLHLVCFGVCVSGLF